MCDFNLLFLPMHLVSMLFPILRQDRHDRQGKFCFNWDQIQWIQSEQMWQIPMILFAHWSEICFIVPFFNLTRVTNFNWLQQIHRVRPIFDLIQIKVQNLSCIDCVLVMLPNQLLFVAVSVAWPTLFRWLCERCRIPLFGQINWSLQQPLDRFFLSTLLYHLWTRSSRKLSEEATEWLMATIPRERELQKPFFHKWYS